MEGIIIRRLTPADDKAIAVIIRKTLEEYGANHAGTVYFDDSTDHLSDVFTVPGAIYHIAELEGVVLGGAGIYPTEGLPGDTCELVKMYLSTLARGKGIGKMLMQRCLTTAEEMGYQKVYLETMPELTDAVPMYKKFGFENLPCPMGNSGHHGCKIWMMKTL